MPREERHMAKGPSILQRPEGQCENLEALGGVPVGTARIPGAEESGVFVQGTRQTHRREELERKGSAGTCAERGKTSLTGSWLKITINLSGAIASKGKTEK